MSLMFSQAHAFGGFANALHQLILTGQTSMVVKPGEEKAILPATRLQKGIKYTIHASGINLSSIDLIVHANDTVGFDTKRKVPARTDVNQNYLKFKYTGMDPNKDKLMLSIRNTSAAAIQVTLSLKIED